MLTEVPQPDGRPFLIHARADLCAIQEGGRILGKKWYLVIVSRLLKRKMGFNELKEAVGSVSAKILAQALGDLQEKGIVDRRLASESPLRVEYSLTEKGEDLERVLVDLEVWGRKWDICKDVHGHATEQVAQPEPTPPAVAPMMETQRTSRLEPMGSPGG